MVALTSVMGGAGFILLQVKVIALAALEHSGPAIPHRLHVVIAVLAVNVIVVVDGCSEPELFIARDAILLMQVGFFISITIVVIDFLICAAIWALYVAHTSSPSSPEVRRRAAS
jgi:hypothetical protein